MDELRALSLYGATFRAAATQLNTRRIAREWMQSMDFRSATVAELEAHATQAAAWATHGFYPSEALPLIAAGMTPELATAADPQTPEERGEYLAAQIDMLNADRPE